MKTLLKAFFVLLLLALAVPAAATEWQAKTDTVWAGRHYREKDGLATGYSENDNFMVWDFDEGTIVSFVVRLPAGHVRADAGIVPKNRSTVVTFNVRITYPATGQVIVDHTVQNQTGKSGVQTFEFMPDTELEHDGWYRIEFTSPDARTNLGRFYYLLFQRESRLAATAANSMMAPAVHLWWSSTDPKAPAGDSFDWIYMEALIPEALKQSCTYQMTIGSNGLYSGIQTNHLLNDDSWTHAVIFSAWDSGDTDKDKTLPDYLRSGAVDVGDEAYAVRFGGEGTGASLRYPEGQRWQTDHWVQMMMYERPDYIETVSTDADGKTKVTPFRSTLLSYWYKQAEETEWHYFGTIRAANTYRMEGNQSGMYSFIENWSGFGGDRYRRVYYRNGSMRSTASGKWFSLNHAGFGSTQSDTKRNSRNDYGHGVTGYYDNCFYVETGGLLGVRDSADTYEPVVQGQMPWVDTIDLQAMRRRVDLALQHNNNKDIRMRIEQTRVVSDPATWKLTYFSDEETVSEGDYGRAAQIMDGNTSSYYHNKSYTPYPHTFDFDAGKAQTITSIGLYQGLDLNNRAKDMQFYVSDNGRTWNLVGTFTFDNDDAPTITLSAPLTSRYFRCRFMSGHGNGYYLAVNEIYFKNEYRLDDLKLLAQQLLTQEDCFGGYTPEALVDLKAVYDEGRITDATALREAIARLGTSAKPLSWGLIDKAQHITSFTAYQLHNPYGYGDLVVDEQGQLAITGATVEGATAACKQPTRVSDPYHNWLVLRSETNKEYYLYNMGVGKYLHLENGEAFLSDQPMNIAVQLRSNDYMLGPRRAHVQLSPTDDTPVGCSSVVDNGSLFALRNNYAIAPADEQVRRQLSACEEFLHVGIIEPSAPAPTFAGSDVVVYNVQGMAVYRGRYESIPQLPHGVYVIRSGSLVQKKLVRE